MRAAKGLVIWVAVAVIALCSAQVSAQGTTSGSIRGTVTDPLGGVMPGVTVRAISDALVGGQLAAVTSEQGVYRFPSLPVGVYVLEASLPGFQSVRQENLRVSLGQTLAVDLQLGDVTVSVEIVVVADAVQVSTVDNNVGFNLGDAFIERQPVRRDPTDLMNYAPGIQDDQAYGAPSTYQNAYNVDGVDVSDPELGSQWVLPSMDWVEEVQVAGLGADAEYGGFTGAVVNLVTKSGGNEFHGDARVYYSGGGLNSENAVEGAEGVNKVDSDVDASVSLGGPVVRDELWYFVSGNMRQRQVEPFYTGGAPLDDREDSDRTESRVLAKLTWQASDSNTVRGFVDWDDVVHDYRGVGDLTLASASQRQESPNWVYSLGWDSLVNSSNFLELKLTGYTGGDDRLPYHGDIPNRLDADTGFDWQNLAQTSNKDVDRLAFDAAWSLFADGLIGGSDSHNFKFGLNYEQSHSDYITRRNGGFSYYDDSYYCDSLEDYFADPFCGVFSSDRGSEWNLKAEMEGLHAFAQDSWQIGNFAINLGVRYSKYTGNFADPVSAPTSGGSDVYDVDTWAPRIGFVWDILGSGKLVFKSHYGIYYEGLTVTMFDREASGDALSDAEYWDYNFDTGEFDIDAGGAVQARAQMDPGIDHPSVEQLVASFEYQLMKDMVIGLDYIQRDYRDINVMVVSNVGDYDAQVTTASPGDSPLAGGTLPFYDLLEPQEYLITNIDFATREYSSVALRAHKRYSNGWSMDGSLVWSDSTGTADYDVAGYGNGFDDLNGFTNADGTLPGNSEWVFKVNGSVDLPWGIIASGFYQWRSGEYWTPYVRLRGLYFNDRTTAFMTPRGSEQYDDRSVLDLRLEKSFKLGGSMALGLFVDAFNVLDSDTVTEVSERWGDYYYDYLDPAAGEWVESSTYGTPLDIQTPREIRLGAKFSW
ncbi:MAG: TonB-dependent receptor [Thermoanaerobaculales bacterium]|jgi:hypothetical protein|nr:TonB-dependent receptor [Thermoanaerobaculales bacterium]